MWAFNHLVVFWFFSLFFQEPRKWTATIGYHPDSTSRTDQAPSSPAVPPLGSPNDPPSPAPSITPPPRNPRTPKFRPIRPKSCPFGVPSPPPPVVVSKVPRSGNKRPNILRSPNHTLTSTQELTKDRDERANTTRSSAHLRLPLVIKEAPMLIPKMSNCPLPVPPSSPTPPPVIQEIPMFRSKPNSSPPVFKSCGVWLSEPRRAGGTIPCQQLHSYTTLSYDVTAFFYPDGAPAVS